MTAEQPATFEERLWPPAWWWPLLVAWTGSLGIAIGYATSTAAGLCVFAAAAALGAAATWLGADRIIVDATGLRAGRSYLAADYVGTARALDAEAATRLRGRDGDARAHLVLRGWVPTAVIVEVDDSADPHPYWFVSTRRPEELSEALRDIGRSDPAS